MWPRGAACKFVVPPTVRYIRSRLWPTRRRPVPIYALRHYGCMRCPDSFYPVYTVLKPRSFRVGCSTAFYKAPRGDRTIKRGKKYLKFHKHNASCLNLIGCTRLFNLHAHHCAQIPDQQTKKKLPKESAKLTSRLHFHAQASPLLPLFPIYLALRGPRYQWPEAAAAALRSSSPSSSGLQKPA